MPLCNLDPKDVRVQTIDAASEASSALMDQHGEQTVRCFELSRDWSWETAHLALTATGSLWCVNSQDCFCKTRSDVGLVDFTLRKEAERCGRVCSSFEPTSPLNAGVQDMTRYTVVGFDVQ